MSREIGDHIPRIKELGLTHISQEQRDHVSEIFGQSFIHPATQNQRIEALNYLRGKSKRKLEGFLAAFVWNFGGRILSDILAQQVEKLEPGSGYYRLNVGFDGHNLDIRKIKTLKEGSDKVENGLFDGASFSSEDGYVKNKIIPGDLPKLLRSGFDELPQLEYVAAGRMFLVGPRGYSVTERESNKILYALKDNSELDNSDEVKWILELHPNLDQAMSPGINNPRSCLRIDLGNHMVRMLLDVLYMQKASPVLDMKIFVKSLNRRIRRAGRVMKQAI